ncbi:MAG: serine/threonine-protein kinase, partial [Candidatus Methylomirabilales bacterium]
MREDSRVECTLVEHRGLQPLKREGPHLLPRGAPDPRERALYLLGEKGSLVLLHPLLIPRRGDIYVLDEVEGKPGYLSCSTGERYRPEDLGELLGELFARIPESRDGLQTQTRIGEDLAVLGASSQALSGAEGGRRLGGYRLVREIGRGGMGVVFEAVQESLGRRVALKVLPGNFALDPRRLERFHREARAAARVHHPSIVSVYEVGEAQGTHFYAMEYIQGSSLDRLIASACERKQNGGAGAPSTAWDPAYIARAIEATANLAEGLHQAHTLGLVHRDVKPSNILVEPGGRYLLV